MTGSCGAVLSLTCCTHPSTLVGEETVRRGLFFLKKVAPTAQAARCPQSWWRPVAGHLRGAPGPHPDTQDLPADSREGLPLPD